MNKLIFRGFTIYLYKSLFREDNVPFTATIYKNRGIDGVMKCYGYSYIEAFNKLKKLISSFEEKISKGITQEQFGELILSYGKTTDSNLNEKLDPNVLEKLVNNLK